MTNFNPPISLRDTNELIEIVSSINDEWIHEAKKQASKELEKRGILEKEQDKLIDIRKRDYNEFLFKEKIRLENNRKESYKIWESLFLLIFGPIIFIAPFFSHSLIDVSSLYDYKTLSELRKENYKLKFKQRATIFTVSFITWLLAFGWMTESKPKANIEIINLQQIEYYNTNMK